MSRMLSSVRRRRLDVGLHRRDKSLNCWIADHFRPSYHALTRGRVFSQTLVHTLDLLLSGGTGVPSAWLQDSADRGKVLWGRAVV
jgi:hypothetical protein